MRDKRVRRQIKIEMIRRGITGAELARRLGVTPQAVYMVISGAFYSEKIGKALIEAGVPAKLLPEYADDEAA